MKSNRMYAIAAVWIISIINPSGLFAQLSPRWSFKTGAAIVASPQVKDLVAYFGSTDSSFYAIDINGGNKRWVVKTGGEIRSTACLENQRLYFVSGDGYLWCLNLNGELQWKFRTEGEKKYELYSFSDYYQSSPAYSDGIIYFGSGDHHIYAVNAQSGKLVWKYKTGQVVHTNPVISGNRLFIGSFDGWFYCLDKRTGMLSWKFKSVGQRYFPKGEFNGSAAVYGNTVFVGARDFNLYALDTTAPFCNWNRSFLKGWAITTPLLWAGSLYVGTSEDRVFLCLDPADGHTKWSFPAGFNVFGSPVINDSTIYFGTMMGKLYGLHARTGESIFQFSTTGNKAHFDKYFKADGQYRDDIRNILTKNEDLIQLYEDMGAILSTPRIIGSQLLVTAMDGYLYCIELTTGKIHQP